MTGHRIFAMAFASVYPAYVSGWAPKGGLRGLGGIYIHDVYFSRYYDRAHYGLIGSQRVTLQLLLSHEVDHLMGVDGHIGPDSALTTHALECSDLGPD